MAVQFETTGTRTSSYFFLPEDIGVDEQFNGRHDAPDISALKADIAERGQIQPVVIRREAGKPLLVSGFSRWRAISELNIDRPPEKRIKVECIYRGCNAQDGYLLNWSENRQRNATTAMDDAHAFQQFAKWGRNVAEIAALCKVTEAHVRSRLSLMEAVPELQTAVSEGRVKPSTAVTAIKKLKAVQQRELAKRNGKVTAKVLAEVSGEPRKPNLKEVRAKVEELRDDTSEEKCCRKTAERILLFMEGH